MSSPRPSRARWLTMYLAASLTALASCAATDESPAVKAAGDPCKNAGTPGATATCLKPTKPPAYYIAEAEAYFATLDVDADPASVPHYSDLVVRWEWPPWLLLTGYTKETLISTAKLLKTGDPSTVPKRDCRFFETQPFARCRVVFQYEGGACPIYEEFVFNEVGEMTFIEAWSDLPDLVPTTDPKDLWGERTDIGRLSTRVPGLGKADGRIEIAGSWMIDAGANDKDVAELAKRAANQWKYWGEEIAAAPTDFFAKGCGWGAKN